MNHFKIIFFMFIVFFCSSLNAQDSMEDRINSVENTVSKLPRILGDVNLRYRYDDVGDGFNSFDIRRARLDFRGNVVKPVEYRIHLDFANSPKMLDAYVNWKINDHLALQTGQYKIPFSLENPYNPNALEMIDNSLAITHLVNYSDVSGLSANGRDIGISLIGNLLRREGFSIINYHIGVFNGSGINRADENKTKDFSGILTINPIKPLSLAVSHYNGRTGAQDNTLKRVRTGFGAKYDNGRLLVRSEYIQGETERLLQGETTSEIQRFKSEGAYAAVGFFVHPKIQPVARYDYFTWDKADDNTGQHYTVGFNYLPVNNLRVQFNYTRRTSRENESNYFAAQLWVKF